MTQSEADAFWNSTDSDHQPVGEEPAQLVDADWSNSGNED